MVNLSIPADERIPMELAGQNSRLVNGIYLDAYLFRLNQLYPFDRALNGRKDHLMQAHLDDLMEFYNGVMDDVVAEDVLRCVLVKSLDSTQIYPRGLWQPEITPGSFLKIAGLRTIGDLFKRIAKSSRPGEGFSYGVNTASRNGYVIPVRHRNNLIILPSQKFVEHCYSVANPQFIHGDGI